MGISIQQPTGLGSNKVSVTAAGTKVQLGSTVCVSVTIKALATNTGLIFVGNSSVSSLNGFQLSAGDGVSFNISNINAIYIDSSVNGEGVTYLFNS